MSFPRRVEPELLDQLPADDPRAIRARRDVRRANTLMMNAGIVASALAEHGAGVAPRTIVDLGSGDGQFMLRVARRLAPRWPGVTVVLQDKQDIVSRATREAFAALRWRVETSATDVFDFLANARSAGIDVVTSNLFLHHFVDEQLVRLLASAAMTVGATLCFGVRLMAIRFGWHLPTACPPEQPKEKQAAEGVRKSP